MGAPVPTPRRRNPFSLRGLGRLRRYGVVGGRGRVRSRNRGYAAGFATLDSVIFFRLNGKAVETILWTSVSYNADLAGNWNEDGTRDREESLGEAVILVRKHKTGGYFDWAKKAAGGRTVTLVWEDGRYAMKGDDPLETSELEIFNDD